MIKIGFQRQHKTKFQSCDSVNTIFMDAPHGLKTKLLEKKLGANYIRMLHVALNKSRK